KQLLGPGWNAICAFSLVFVLYSLTYAYIFVGGGITQSLIEPAVHVPRPVAATLFIVVLAAFVVASTQWVGRFSTVLIGLMVVCFLLAVARIFPHVSPAVLLNTGGQPFYGPYLWLALPVCLASFGFHGNVPGLVVYQRSKASGSMHFVRLGVGTVLICAVASGRAGHIATQRVCARAGGRWRCGGVAEGHVGLFKHRGHGAVAACLCLFRHC